MSIQPRLIEFDPIIAYICLAFALIAGGCRDGQECSVDETYGSDVVRRFQQEVAHLADRIDSDENSFRESAYALFREATRDSNHEYYEELSSTYIQCATGICFDVENSVLGSEKELGRLDGKLRNHWNFTKWAVATILYHHPERIEGWEMLAGVALKYKSAAMAAERASEKSRDARAIQRMRLRRFSIFRDEMTAMSDSLIRQIGITYGGLRHRLNSSQRREIVTCVKSVLGSLPEEMQKDDDVGLVRD